MIFFSFSFFFSAFRRSIILFAKFAVENEKKLKKKCFRALFVEIFTSTLNAVIRKHHNRLENSLVVHVNQMLMIKIGGTSTTSSSSFKTSTNSFRIRAKCKCMNMVHTNHNNDGRC